MNLTSSIFFKPFIDLYGYVVNFVLLVKTFCHSFIVNYHTLIPGFFRFFINLNIYTFFYAFVEVIFDNCEWFRYRDCKYTFLAYAGLALTAFYFGHLMPDLTASMIANGTLAESSILASASIWWMLRRLSEYFAVASVLNIRNKDRYILLDEFGPFLGSVIVLTLLVLIFIALCTLIKMS